MSRREPTPGVEGARPEWAGTPKEEPAPGLATVRWTRPGPGPARPVSTQRPAEPPQPTEVPRRGLTLRQIAPALIVLASLIAGLLGGRLAGHRAAVPNASATTPVVPTATATAASGPDFTAVYQAVAPAVVEISVRKGGKVVSVGSGVIVDPAGTIITNDHVVTVDRVSVHLADGTTHAATVVGRQPASDLAVVRLVD